MKRLMILTLAVFALSAACNRPDPDPDSEHASQDSVSVDLAASCRLTADDLLDSGLKAAVKTASDGSRFVEYEGDPISYTIGALSAYDGGRPFRKYCNFEITYDFTLGNAPSVPAGASGEIDLSTLMPSSVNLGSRSKGTTLYATAFPDGLQSIEAITLTENSRIQVSLSIPDCFFTDGTAVPSFEVDMNRFFESSDAENGILRFDAPMSPDNGWSVTREFRLTGAVFDPSGFDAKNLRLQIEASIGLAGKVVYDQLKTTAAKLRAASGPIKLHVCVILFDVECATIRGSFGFRTKEASKTLNLRDFASMVSAFDFSGSDIVFKAGSDLPIPGFVNLSLTGKAGRKTYVKTDNISIPVPAAAEGGMSSASLTLNAAGGYETLFSQFPEDLEIAAVVASDPETVGTLEVGKAFSASLIPAIRVPLVYAKDYSATYRDTVSVSAQVREALLKGEARIVGEISNSLPLQSRVSVKLISDSGTGLTAEVGQDVAPGAKESVSMTLRNTAGSSIGQATKAVISYQLTGVEEGKPLSRDGSIQANLKLRYLPVSE